MSRPTPAATGTIRILRFLASQPAPTAASHIARAVGLPRSSTYHLLNAMAGEGFVTHYTDDRCWGLGVGAYEVGVAYASHEPLQRLARIPLARLVDHLGLSAHLVTLHGNEVVYILEERARGRPPLVTDVGVRLPAHLTASGRAILAALPQAQVRALYPNREAFIDRNGIGPKSLSALGNLLVDSRRRGYATEDGEVTPGFTSVAAVVAPPAPPARASIAVTYPSDAEVSVPTLVRAVTATANEVSRRLHGRTR